DPEARPAARAARAPGRACADLGDALVSVAEEPDELLVELPNVPPVLAVLPLKETVVFPDAMTPLAIGQERSMRLVEAVVSEANRMLALVTVRNTDVEEPGFDDLYEIGTAAVVHKMIRVPDGTLRILVQGVAR